MSDNMHDLSGWAPITCAQSDVIREGKRPVSSLTDPSGTYGTPVVYTEWADALGVRPVLRDYRWPGAERECAHYAPEPDAYSPAYQCTRPDCTEPANQGHLCAACERRAGR